MDNIESLKRELAELSRRSALANEEVKKSDQRRMSARRSVGQLRRNIENNDQIRNAEEELRRCENDYDEASRNYYSIADEAKQKNLELMREEANVRLQTSQNVFRR